MFNMDFDTSIGELFLVETPKSTTFTLSYVICGVPINTLFRWGRTSGKQTLPFDSMEEFSAERVSYFRK